MVSVVGVLACLLLLQRGFELRLAAINRRRILALGGQEHSPGHYPCFILLHSAWFAAWLLEAHLTGNTFSPLWPLLLILILAAQILRYSAIRTLGLFWNTRILTLPGSAPVTDGPYRYLRHPNYLAVTLEFAAIPLLFTAWHTALIFSALNAILLLAIRIPAEEKALSQTLPEPPPTP